MNAINPWGENLVLYLPYTHYRSFFFFSFITVCVAYAAPGWHQPHEPRCSVCIRVDRVSICKGAEVGLGVGVVI